MVRVTQPLVRLIVVTVLVGFVFTIFQHNDLVQATSPHAASATPVPTLASGSPSSSDDAVLPADGEWTLYPVASMEQGIVGTDYAEGNAFSGYNKTAITIPGVKITATAGSITLENFVKKPLLFTQLGPTAYGAQYNSQTAQDRLTMDSGGDSLLLLVDSPQQVWLIYGQIGMEYAAKTLFMALPGTPITPDPRYGTTQRCPGANDPLLKAGDKAIDVGINSNNLRADAKQSAKLLDTLKPGTEMEVLQGPVCNSNLAYWQVNVNGVVGWTADSQQSDHSYWLLPERTLTIFGQVQQFADQIRKLPIIYADGPSGGNAVPTPIQQAANQCPGSPAPRLHIGGQGRVLPGDPNILNTQPRRPSLHADSKRILGIPAGGTFDVLEGPECADGITWWQVSYRGAVGWTGESDTGYWVEPADGSVDDSGGIQ